MGCIIIKLNRVNCIVIVKLSCKCCTGVSMLLLILIAAGNMAAAQFCSNCGLNRAVSASAALQRRVGIAV